ncbi:MAG: Uma2 family endonuclease [Gemmatimonadota bacterium]
MATMPTPSDKLLTLEEYLQLPEEDWPFSELVQGRLVREPPPGYVHGKLQSAILAALSAHIGQAELPLACVGPMGFVLERNPDTVRGPDVAVVPRPPTLLPSGFIEGSPLLAVEIVSPSNRAAEIQAKVQDYLGAGAKIVWVVQPRTQEITVHRPAAEPVFLRRGDTLDGGEVLPGLRLAVAELFEE